MSLGMQAMNIQPHPYFIEKTIQLYDMTIVRHGLMVVGLPFSGKTSALKVLAFALSDMTKKGKKDEKEVYYEILNPKSITMGQLYGKNDEISHDW
jgi:dynein heavy chain